MIWQDLVRVSLMGTDKATPSVSTLAELQKLGVKSDELSECLLEGAGILSILCKGAFPLKQLGTEIMESCEIETQEHCSSKSAMHLKEILRGGHKPAFTEYLYYVEKKGKILPPEFLPEIFHAFRGDRQLHYPISRTMGKRGEWLVTLNSDWQQFNNKNISDSVYFTPLSREETLTQVKALIDLLKGYSFIWSDDKKLNAELRDFAYSADIDLIENIEALFESNLSYQWANKANEAVNILRFRKKMIDEI